MLNAIATGIVSGSLMSLGMMISDKKTKVVVNKQEVSQKAKNIAGGTLVAAGIAVLTCFMVSE